MGLSIINHLLWGTPLYRNPQNEWLTANCSTGGNSALQPTCAVLMSAWILQIMRFQARQFQSITTSRLSFSNVLRCLTELQKGYRNLIPIFKNPQKSWFSLAVFNFFLGCYQKKRHLLRGLKSPTIRASHAQLLCSGWTASCCWECSRPDLSGYV